MCLRNLLLISGTNISSQSINNKPWTTKNKEQYTLKSELCDISYSFYFYGEKDLPIKKEVAGAAFSDRPGHCCSYCGNRHGRSCGCCCGSRPWGGNTYARTFNTSQTGDCD